MSSLHSEIHHRKSIRLKGYNYSQNGEYFITICTKDRQHLFGKIENGEMVLNNLGKIAEQKMINTGKIRKNISVEHFVIMPNHVHAIIGIDMDDNMGVGTAIGNGRGTVHRAPTIEQFGKPTKNSIPNIVRSYKATVTKQINILRNAEFESVWQRNYHEHIIRNEKSFEEISEYIVNNPQNWEQDCFYS